ncbi:hypothetical protein V6N13_018827 [Hibiscus sabdariffa]
MSTGIGAHQKDYKRRSDHGQNNESIGIELSNKSCCWRGTVQFGSTVRYAKHNLGATTTMNTWGPSTSHDQASFANLWIANGPMDLFYAVFT